MSGRKKEPNMAVPAQTDMSSGALAVTDVDPGTALLRLGEEKIVAMARTYPRDEAAILQECLDEMELVPEMAQQAVYRKPVGEDKHGKMQYAEGLSIRAAEMILSKWGNYDLTTSMEEPDEAGVTIHADFVDFQRMTHRRVSERVSRYYKDRHDNIRKWADDRFFDVVVPSRRSRMVRELVLRSISPAVRLKIQRKAEQVVAGVGRKVTLPPLPERRKQMLEAFKELGVTKEQICKHLRVSVRGITEQHLVTLRGLYNAIKEGTPVEEVFGKEEPEAPAPTGPEPTPEAAQPAEEQSELLTKFKYLVELLNQHQWTDEQVYELCGYKGGEPTEKMVEKLDRAESLAANGFTYEQVKSWFEKKGE